jgi:hypothetical protein
VRSPCACSHQQHCTWWALMRRGRTLGMRCVQHRACDPPPISPLRTTRPMHAGWALLEHDSLRV